MILGHSLMSGGFPDDKIKQSKGTSESCALKIVHLFVLMVEPTSRTKCIGWDIHVPGCVFVSPASRGKVICQSDEWQRNIKSLFVNLFFFVYFAFKQQCFLPPLFLFPPPTSFLSSPPPHPFLPWRVNKTWHIIKLRQDQDAQYKWMLVVKQRIDRMQSREIS